MRRLLGGVILLGLIIGPVATMTAQQKDVKEKQPAAKDKDKEKSAKQAPAKTTPTSKSTPTRATLQKNTPDKAATPTEKWIKLGQVSGKILGIDESKKTIKLQVMEPKFNPNGLRGLYQAEMNAARAHGRNAYNAERQVMQAQNNLYQMKATDYELQTMDDLKVRRLNPPEMFDDKGRIRRLSAKERSELKGSGNDRRLPGYVGEFSDLKANQVVAVTLMKKKKMGGPRPAGKKSESENSPENLPQISMIVILHEAK